MLDEDFLGLFSQQPLLSSFSPFYRWGNEGSENLSDFSQCHTVSKRQSWNLKPKLVVSMLNTLMLVTCLQTDGVDKTLCPSVLRPHRSGRPVTVIIRSHDGHVSVFRCFCCRSSMQVKLGTTCLSYKQRRYKAWSIWRRSFEEKRWWPWRKLQSRCCHNECKSH